MRTARHRASGSSTPPPRSPASVATRAPRSTSSANDPGCRPARSTGTSRTRTSSSPRSSIGPSSVGGSAARPAAACPMARPPKTCSGPACNAPAKHWPSSPTSFGSDSCSSSSDGPKNRPRVARYIGVRKATAARVAALYAIYFADTRPRRHRQLVIAHHGARRWLLHCERGRWCSARQAFDLMATVVLATADRLSPT